MPNSFWATFRIAEVGNSDQRYQDLVTAIEELSPPKVWKEPTSFYAFYSVLDLDGVAKHLKQFVDPRYDVLFIGRIGYKSYRIVGGKDADVFEFFPELQRS